MALSANPYPLRFVFMKTFMMVFFITGFFAVLFLAIFFYLNDFKEGLYILGIAQVFHILAIMTYPPKK